LGRFETSFRDADLAGLFEAVVPEHVPTATLLVTDRSALAKRSENSVVFVGSRLDEFMQVLLNPQVRGVLLPRDLTSSNIEALAAGSSVFSACSAEDLTIPRTTHLLLAYLAHGYPSEEAAQEVGYSARHVRRITHRFKRTAGLDRDYPWALLAPLFPK
jgi:hypothetical protein